MKIDRQKQEAEREIKLPQCNVMLIMTSQVHVMVQEINT